MFRYVPYASVCTNGEVGKDCDVRVFPNTEGEYDKELLTFRVRAGEEITVTPGGLLHVEIETRPYGTVTTKTWCFAEGYRFTPVVGDIYRFHYEYDSTLEGCRSFGTKIPAAP
jgi:hypothetical protein